LRASFAAMCLPIDVCLAPDMQPLRFAALVLHPAAWFASLCCTARRTTGRCFWSFRCFFLYLHSSFQLVLQLLDTSV
jgi:hypothetical protein